MNYVVDDVIV